MKRRPTVTVPRLEIHAPVQQEGHALCVPVVRRHVQRGRSQQHELGIEIRAAGQQEGNAVHVPVQRRQLQRRSSHPLGRIDICPPLQQQRNAVCVPLACCLVQRGVAFPVRNPHQPSVLVQQPTQLRRVSIFGSCPSIGGSPVERLHTVDWLLSLTVRFFFRLSTSEFQRRVRATVQMDGRSRRDGGSSGGSRDNRGGRGGGGSSGPRRDGGGGGGRGGPREAGSKVVVLSNLFPLRGGDDASMETFDVRFDPAPKTREARSAVLEECLKGAPYAYDGEAIAVASAGRDLSGTYTAGKVTVTITSTGKRSVHENAQVEALVLRPYGIPQLSRTVFAPNGVDRGAPGPDETVMMVPTLKQLPHTSADGTRCVSVNPGVTALLKPMPVRDFLKLSGVKPGDRAGIENALRGLRVSLESIKRPGARTVRSISSKVCGDITFTDANNRPITLVEYWAKTYNLKIYPGNYAICTREDERGATYFPFEACSIATKQRPRESPEIVEATLLANTISPFDRDRQTRAAVSLSPLARDAGIRIEQQPLVGQGVVQEMPSLLFAKNARVKDTSSWNMRDRAVVRSVKALKWQVVLLG